MGKINYIIWGWGLSLYNLGGFTYSVFAWIAYD
jgi:hypothetical protein